MIDKNSRLSALREEEAEIRSRSAELADAATERDLSSDEIAEIDEKRSRLDEVGEQIRALESALSVGAYSSRSNDSVGANDREIGDFSLLKLLRALDPRASQEDRDAAGMELEMSNQVEKQTGRSTRNANSAFIPVDLMGTFNAEKRGANGRREARDLTAEDSASAANLIGVDFRPQNMIELLRNTAALTPLGVTYLDGLTGDVSIPKHTGAGTVGWLGFDGDSVPETSQTVGQVTLRPRTMGAYTDYTRQLRLQQSVSVEQFIRQDLMTVVALEQDRAAIHGSGTGGEPVGVENTTGIGAQSFSTSAAPTRSEVIGMWSDLDSQNALLGTQSFLTETSVYANMLDTVIDAGSGKFLVDDNGRVIGYPVQRSNQVTDGQMFFANWSDLLIGTWGGMEIMVDPYTGATAGTTRVIIFMTMDVVVRHPESFCLGQ